MNTINFNETDYDMWLAEVENTIYQYFYIFNTEDDNEIIFEFILN